MKIIHFGKKKLKEKENNDEKKSDNDDNSNDEELNEILFGGIPFSGNDIFIIDKLPIKPFKLSLMLLPAPISYSPSANTIAARRAIRYVFASLLRHHGVISEAMTCVNFLETFGALQVSKTTHPLLNELAKLWDVALALKHELAEQYDYEIINKNENINNNTCSYKKKKTIVITGPRGPPICSIPEDKDIDPNDMNTPQITPDSCFSPNTPYSQIDDRLDLNASEDRLQFQIRMELQETEEKFEKDKKIHLR
eukprot:710661_1